MMFLLIIFKLMGIFNNWLRIRIPKRIRFLQLK